MSSETGSEEEIRALVCRARQSIADDVRWSDITKLDLSDCGISSLPDSFAILLSNLSVLFLSNNKFTEMPEIIGKCKNLQMVAFKDNGMVSIHPEALQPQLRWLILTNNMLTEIPDTIGRCVQLQKCMLSGNRLTKLPDAVVQLHRLELIRLASNRLSEPPLSLLELPQLRWVALGDNPFLDSVEPLSLPAAKVIAGLDEGSGTVLGQGAGGTTRAVRYEGRTVAVKVYGGAMTSDGLPATERNISWAASQLDSPALIRVWGECESTGSLVMEYLEHYSALAAPPSWESCSRDVYGGHDSPCPALSWEEASNLVTVLLEALALLHRSGITHGDFYGHNILVQRSNLKHVRLSDFGAAFFYDPKSAYGRLLHTIELRAFAVLVEEVTSLLNECARTSWLRELVSQCHETSATFDQVQIWWQQKLLADMAAAFGVDLV